MKFAEGHEPKVGKSSFANMPSEVVMKEYPKSKALRGGMIDDTITGVDAVNSENEAFAMRHLSNQK